jgi:hypothetical protein
MLSYGHGPVARATGCYGSCQGGRVCFYFIG